MSIITAPLHSSLGAEIGGVDLTQAVAPGVFAEIEAALNRYAVLVFPNQAVTDQQQIAFSRLFGPLETTPIYTGDGRRRLQQAELSDISNLDSDGRVMASNDLRRLYSLGNQLWHTDSSFKYRPALCSLLYSTTIAPIGGHTEFADQRAAYDALPPAMKQRLDGLVAEHSIETSRRRTGFAEFSADEAKRLPPVPQMLVRTVPESGRRSLYVASHAGRIFEMPDAEGRALLEDLMAHVTQRQFVYIHRWRPHELVMWDNRCTMHRGTDYDDLRWVRDMRRATVSDVANTCEQAGVAVPA